MENKNTNKYLVVYQLPDGLIYNRILNAKKLTEDVISSWEDKIEEDWYVTILNIIKLDE